METELREKVPLHFPVRDIAQIQRAHRDLPLLVEGLHRKYLVLQRCFQHAPPDLSPRPNVLAVDGRERIAFIEAGSRCKRVGGRLGDDRPHLGQAVHEQAGVDEYRKDEIERRSCGDDEKAFPYLLPVERSWKLRGLDVALSFIEHLHVAAEWHCGQRPFGSVAASTPGRNRFAESHREAQHLDVAQARSEVVPILVYDDKDSERHHEGNNGMQKAHAARPIIRATAENAALRPRASASSTVARDAAGAVGTVSSAASMTS